MRLNSEVHQVGLILVERQTESNNQIVNIYDADPSSGNVSYQHSVSLSGFDSITLWIE